MWVLAAAVTLTVAFTIRNTLMFGRLVHWKRLPIPPDAASKAFREVPGLEDVALRAADGLTLRGWFAPGARDAVVIFVHGGGGNRLQLLPEARIFARHGYGILVYDSRAHGESEGELVSWGDHEELDVRAALDYVTARTTTRPPRVVLLGFSMGSSAVVLAAADDPRANAVVLYATWTSLEDEMKRNSGKYGPLSWGPALYVLRRAGVDVGRVAPLQRIAAIAPRPLLMVAGDEDDDTPLSVMQRLFAAAGPPKELWVVPGAGHGGYLRAGPEAYEAHVVGFVDRALSQPPGL